MLMTSEFECNLGTDFLLKIILVGILLVMKDLDL